MIGSLPKSLEINGVQYAIRSDYRNILQIFEAFADKDLKPQDKLYVCLKRLYCDFESIPKQFYEEAYNAAIWFIECGQKQSRSNSPAVLNWVKDEQIIFPAVNKAAGFQVRAVQYVHWWTFMGYFQAVDREDLFSTVLSIRQKRARGKKLEKWEKDFYTNNRDLCSMNDDSSDTQSAKDAALSIFKELIAEGGE